MMRMILSEKPASPFPDHALMSEWWSYRPEDLLLFSPRVYWRMFELHNGAFWPLHLLTLAAGIVIILLVFRQPRAHGLRAAFIILAVLWIFVGWFFLWNRYATINWAIAYVAPLFGLEALLLGLCGGAAFDRSDFARWMGLLIAAAGLVVYPFLPMLFGRPWTSAEVFGIAPDPTAIVTLGVLLPARGRLALLLFPIPLAWLLLSGVTLRVMGDPQGLIPLLSAAAALAALFLRHIVQWRRS